MLPRADPVKTLCSANQEQLTFETNDSLSLTADRGVCRPSDQPKMATVATVTSSDSTSDSLIFEEESHQFYEEVVKDNRKYFKCSICQRLLSRKQRIECHLQSIHGKGPFKRKYKLYIQDPSLPIPRTTRFNQKRSKTSLADHELTTATSVSTCTFAASVVTSCVESYNASSVSREPECTNIDNTEALEGNFQSEPLSESPFLDHSEDSDLDGDGNSFEDVVSSSEVESDGDNDDDDNDTSDEDKSSDHNSSLAGSFSDQEKACMAILSYVSRHCITSEAAKDMIDLIKTACPENETFRTLTYCKVQEVCGKCELHVYDICEKCLALFPLDDPNKYYCSTANCNGLRYKGSAHQQSKREHKNSFVTVNIQDQLKDLLERDGIWSTIQNRIKCRGKEVIEDIMDGKYYIKLCEKGQFLHNKSNISLIFNTDGAPLYSSSSVSLWPVFLAVNELPSPDRFSKQNMLMWGIWQGKGKPPFNVYFEPFATQMTKLYNDGVQIVLAVDQSPITVKAAVILGSADLQGKSYLLCMTQHNGESGCLTCEEPGIVVKQGKGHARCYPYRIPEETSPNRTTSSFLTNAVAAHQGPRKKVAGIFDVTSLALMPWFDIVVGMVPDYMHGCLLGITKTLLYKWLSASNYKQPYFIGGQIANINKRLQRMRPPDYLSRLPRDLEKHFKNLKASELQAWLLYYALPCLIGYLPDKYLLHFGHLAEGIFILLGDAITPFQLNRAKDLLHTFYRDFQSLYGDGSCGLNVHNAGVHLADYVQGWGPLWAWSTFGFEDMNGTIMDLTHGTGNVCRQVLWMLHAQSRLRCDIQLMENSAMKHFIERMLNTKRGVKNLKAAQGCQIAGGAKKLNGLSQDLLEKINIETTSQTKMKVLRIVKNGHVYFSKEYTRMVKRNSSVALFENGKVGEIEFFVWDRDSGLTLAVFREVYPDLGKPFFFQDAGHHILRMKPERSELQVERIEKLQEKVFFLEGNKENICLIRVPNFRGVCG